MDGVIDSGPILAAGAGAAAVGVAVGLWRMDEERIPPTGVMAAAFFVTSLIQVPLGATSVHLTLVGLAGVLLGWAVFPAVLVALLLQMILFGIGGWTTLGINTLTFGVPAVVCYYLLNRPLRRRPEAGPAVFALGFAAGSIGMVLSCLSFSGFLLFSGEEFFETVCVVLGLHLPIVVLEGIVTGTIAVSLKRLRPQIFQPVTLAAAKECGHG
jgi:cobalt/nickel transport system permease protein